MRVLCLLSILIIAGCSDIDPSHPAIIAHVEGFNTRDISLMAAQQHPDAEWLAVNGSEVTRITDKAKDWNAEMKRLFDDASNMKGELHNWSRAGNYISVTETASWTEDNGVKMSQETLTVYQIEDELIRRVWYYPSSQD